MTRKKKLIAVIIAMAVLVLALIVGQGSVASAAERPVAWKSTFVWKHVPVPTKCSGATGKSYTFALQGRRSTGYLTAESKLRLRVQRPGGKIVVRKYALVFGDGDLVWMPTIGPREKIKRAVVVASGEGRRPRKMVDVYCGIVMP